MTELHQRTIMVIFSAEGKECPMPRRSSKKTLPTIAAALVGVVIGFAGATGAKAALSISKQPTQNVVCSDGVCSATAPKAILNVLELASMLSSGDVELQSGSIAQDIEIDAPISWASGSRLTLDSYRSIFVDRPVTVAGLGGITIRTNDGGTGGDYSFAGKGHIEFWDLNSSLVINGNSYGLYKSIKKLARAARRQAHFYALASSYNAARDGIYAHTPIPVNTGAFEGLGNTISNLTINDSTSGDLVALFSTNSSIGTIRDIGLFNAAITGGSEHEVGTLVGENSGGTIANCYATGSASGSPAAGGLVHDNLGTISNSYAAVAVSAGSNGAAGGLVAYNMGIVQQSYATGSVTGGDNSSVGGLIGSAQDSFLADSYATGAVTGGNNSAVGGLVGADIHDKTILSSYSTGAVSGGPGASVGGLIGSDIEGGRISDAYWDLDTSGVSNPHQGAGNMPDDPGITGLSDAQLKSGLPAGFDKKVWKEKAPTNNGYPYLRANPPP